MKMKTVVIFGSSCGTVPPIGGGGGAPPSAGGAGPPPIGGAGGADGMAAVTEDTPDV